MSATTTNVNAQPAAVVAQLPADVVAKLDTAQLLAAHASGALSLSALQAEIDRRSAPPVRAITYKVSDKGALSVYGLNARFPVTLYRAQWERLDSDEERKRRAEFIAKNASKLATKQ